MNEKNTNITTPTDNNNKKKRKKKKIIPMRLPMEIRPIVKTRRYLQ